jgi:carbon storage regulator
MLVLSRKAGQSIIIGSDIVVTVLDVKGDQVRLGINAPRTLTVHRQEVQELIKAENTAAAAASVAALGDLDSLVPEA